MKFITFALLLSSTTAFANQSLDVVVFGKNDITSSSFEIENVRIIPIAKGKSKIKKSANGFLCYSNAEHNDGGCSVEIKFQYKLTVNGFVYSRSASTFLRTDYNPIRNRPVEFASEEEINNAKIGEVSGMIESLEAVKSGRTYRDGSRYAPFYKKMNLRALVDTQAMTIQDYDFIWVPSSCNQ